MKIPTTPQYTKKDIQTALELAHNPAVLDAVFKENTRYLHWEEVRRRKYPVDSLYIWVLMKIFRSKDAHSVSFADWIFSYSLNDSCWKRLHLLDKTAAGNLSSILDAVGHERERYIINSLMEEAIASSQLEGAAPTRRVAKQMLREQRKPRTRGERMIVNNYLTMKEVRTLKTEDLSPELILKLHAMITAGTLDDPDDEGRFRNNDDTFVVDGSGTVLHTPPPYKDIPGYIQELCRFANAEQEGFIHPIVKGIILHFLIGYLHPFNDGNGRCARTIFYWYVLKHDYWLFEYMAISRAIKDTKGKYKLAYLFTETDNNDLTYFIRYNIGTIGRTIEEIQQYLQRKQKEQHMMLQMIKDREDITIRQGDILKRFAKYPDKRFTIKEIMEIYHVAYATARSDLLHLADIGYIKQGKSGKQIFFTFREMAPTKNKESD